MLDFTKPPKTAEEAEARLAELDAAEPGEIRDALVRAIKQARPDITQSEVVADLAWADATLGFGLLTAAELEAARESLTAWGEYAQRMRSALRSRRL